jgi:exonuclease III
MSDPVDSKRAAAPSPSAPTRAPSLLTVATLNVEQRLRKSWPELLSWATSHSTDFLCLQETGDVAIPSKLLHDSGYSIVMDGLEHAGVAVVMRAEWRACVRSVLRHSTDAGRLVAVQIESKRTHLLIISAYMPTSLDRVADASADAARARELYDVVQCWAAVVPEATVLLLGDLNETMAAADRNVVRAGSHHNRFISLVADFTDCYRSMHPSGGWTCRTPLPGGDVAAARLDYVLLRSLHRVSVSNADVIPPPMASRHCAVVVRLQLVLAPPPSPPPLPPTIPNMKAATPRQRQQCSERFEQWVRENERLITAGCSSPSTSILDSLTNAFVSAAQSATAAALPMLGRRPFMSDERIRLRQHCRCLYRLRNFLRRCRDQPDLVLSHSEQLSRLVQQCGSLVDIVRWGVPHANIARWVLEVGLALSSARREEKRAVEVMKACSRDKWSDNPAAFVRRMLHGDRQPDLSSIIDPSDNSLVSEPDAVKHVLSTHYTSVFHSSSRTSSSPPWVDTMYSPRKHIDPLWYAGLMDEVSPQELRLALAPSKTVCAPGRDGISVGVWKWLATSDISAVAICGLLSSCLRLRFTPSVARHSIIVPILKKPSEPRELNNVRPISLQCALFKVLSKVLASRLGRILSSHPILHSAQRGFLPGGSSAHCIDNLLDVWEHAHESKDGSAFTLFYDIKQAYDSVNHDDLLLSLRRLRMPTDFVDFIADSLTDLTASVRTAHGLTPPFPVRRSLRQGDPLACLLFVCFIDPLHCGLDLHPLDNKRHGYPIGGTRVGSIGFADDTTIIASTAEGLQRQHQWACDWIAFVRSAFQPKKCELVAMRDRAVADDVSVRFGDVELESRALDRPVRYLGAHIQPDLGHTAAITAITKRINHYCAAIRRVHLRVDRAIWVVNNFLIPAISYALPFCSPTKAEARGWDQLVARMLCAVSGSVRRFKPAALAAITGVILPSHHAVLVRTTECFIRLNSSAADAAIARTRWLSKDQRPSVSRLRRICQQAANIGITFTQSSASPARRSLECDGPPAGVERHTADDSVVVFGSSSSWGATAPVCSLVAYTDGSYAHGRSAWSVCFQNSWLRLNHLDTPDEDSIRMHHTRQAVVVGAPLRDGEGSGVFDAELNAIARALLAPSLSTNLTLFIDSQSAIAAVGAFSSARSERARLRMAGYPILHLISNIITRKQQLHATVDLRWIPAHTSASSVHHSGNRIADLVAKHYTRPTAVAPSFIRPLQLESMFAFVRLQSSGRLVVGDPRRAIRRLLESQLIAEWERSRTQSRFAVGSGPASSRALWLAAARLSPTLCPLVLRIATDTAQWTRNDGKVIESVCSARSCTSIATLTHIASCRELNKRGMAGANYAVCCLLAPASRTLSSRTVPLSINADLLHTLKHCGIISAVSSGAELAGVVGLFDHATATSALLRLGVTAALTRTLLPLLRLTVIGWIPSLL